MAVCETSHWTLDCGDGHGCYLVEYSDTGQPAGWGCSSELVTGRPRPSDDQTTYIDGAAMLEFCCHDITRATLAQALDDLVAEELVVPKGTHGEVVSHTATGTLDEIVRGVGLSARV